MTEEQIKQEAEEYAKENYCDEVRATARNAYLDCAKLKEKRIADLEKHNKELQVGLAVAETFNKSLNSMNKELEKERNEYRNMVFDLKEQIEKMKCCNNCIHRYFMAYKSVCAFEKTEIKDIENPITCKCEKWELEEN